MLSPLSHLIPGHSARIILILTDSSFTDSDRREQVSIQERLLDLGFEPGARVSCLFQKGRQSISAYLIKGAVIALRKEDADWILTEEQEDS